MSAMDQERGRERSYRDGISRKLEAGERETLRRARGGGDPLDQRVDRWMSAGRQFVEGVAGTRPGSRPAPRAAERPGERGSQRRPRFDELGRWVEGRLDWLLDDGDDWREPWQEPDRGAPAAAPLPSPGRSPRRQGLEAVSRRGLPSSGPQASYRPAGDPSASYRPASNAEHSKGDPRQGETSNAEAANPRAGDDDWPDEDSFSLPRWQRPAQAGGSSLGGDRSGAEPPLRASRDARPLPRSSRRRS